MEIILFFEEGPGSGNIRTMLHDLVSAAAARVGVDTCKIKTVGLATDESYAVAVNELFPGSQYTDSNGYLGVGKTETKLTSSGPEHHILFHLYVFELCLQGKLGVGGETGDWPADLQYGPYIISHELGHCRFNETSSCDLAQFNQLRLRNDDFDSINDYQFSVLVGEIGACYYGDRFYGEPLFKHACEQGFIPLGELRRDITTAKSKQDIQSVAYLANGLAWLYPIQYAKIALGLRGTDLHGAKIQPPEALSDFSEVNNLLSQAIDAFCNSRFEEAATFREKIYLARELLLEHHLNVKISKDSNGWSCFWN